MVSAWVVACPRAVGRLGNHEQGKMKLGVDPKTTNQRMKPDESKLTFNLLLLHLEGLARLLSLAL
jgi:hypothetical protein